MNARQQFFDRISTLNNLPTLPHILQKLLEACNQDSVDLDEIAAIVSKDPVLSAKLLKLVNSAFFGLAEKVQEINQAVVYVGTGCIKNMALCACIYEALPTPVKNGRFNLKSFWWHSLRCAFLSKHLAMALKLEQSDDAFISGLLHDIGKVVLWVTCGTAYEDAIEQFKGDTPGLIEEEARLGATHCEVGVWLLNCWKLHATLSDPVRYHHEMPDRIAQALPMTQIVYLANLLCKNDETKRDSGIELAKRFFGLTPKACLSSMENADEEAGEVADVLGIDINVDDSGSPVPDRKDQQVKNELVQDVHSVSLLMGTLEGFLSAKDCADILTVISDGLGILFDSHRPMFFLVDRENKVLSGFFINKSGRYVAKRNLSVSMSLHQSLLVKAIIEEKPVNSFDAGSLQSLTILDEQIIRLTGGQGIFCHPLIANGEPVGVLVLAVQKRDLVRLLKNAKLLTVFLHKGALALRLDQLKKNQFQEIQTTRMAATSDLARKVVHEVNNPLSIIKNYLKILEMKLPGEDGAIDEIRIINEEISRVSELLKKLTDFSGETKPHKKRTDINKLLSDIVKLTREALFRQAKMKIETDFQSPLPMVEAEKAGLKQVFINLIKNATEAMQSGGTLLLRTRLVPPPIGFNRAGAESEANGSVEIQFIDDGPGIQDTIKKKLFDPYVSTKRGGHCGLGLSIAYNIVKSFHGNLSCEREVDKGAVFTVELPLDQIKTAYQGGH